MRWSIIISCAMLMASAAGCERSDLSRSPEAMAAKTVVYQGNGGALTMRGKFTVTFFDHYVQIVSDGGDRTVVPRERLVSVESAMLVSP